MTFLRSQSYYIVEGQPFSRKRNLNGQSQASEPLAAKGKKSKNQVNLIKHSKMCWFAGDCKDPPNLSKYQGKIW